MKRDFESLIKFCEKNKRFKNMAYSDAFDRIINYRENNHSGHFKQLFEKIYDFYSENPHFLDIPKAPPFEISEHEDFLNEWRDFIFEDEISDNLPISVGGNATDGGRWSPTAKIMFSVVAFYMK